MTTRVVIPGSGFGGAYRAQERERRSEDVDVPLLEVGTGSLQAKHVLLPLRSLVRRSGFKMTEVPGEEAGPSRKVRVALDWTLDLLSSRDYVPLGVQARSRPRAAPAGAGREERLDGVLEKA
jgi:hypothetical protein